MKYIVFLNRHYTLKDAHLVLIECKRVRGYVKYIVFLNRHFTPTDAHLVLVEFKRVRGYVKYIVFLNRHYTLKDAHLVLVQNLLSTLSHFVTEFSKCYNMSQNFRQASFVTESHHVTGNHISAYV